MHHKFNCTWDTTSIALRDMRVQTTIRETVYIKMQHFQGSQGQQHWGMWMEPCQWQRRRRVMVVAKAAATEVTNYSNCGNEVKVVVENVGLPRRYQWRTRSVWVTIASMVMEESRVGHADSGERGKIPGRIENWGWQWQKGHQHCQRPHHQRWKRWECSNRCGLR